MSGKCPYEKVSLPGFNNIYIAKMGVSHTMNGYNSVCSGKVSLPSLIRTLCPNGHLLDIYVSSSSSSSSSGATAIRRSTRSSTTSKGESEGRWLDLFSCFIIRLNLQVLHLLYYTMLRFHRTAPNITQQCNDPTSCLYLHYSYTKKQSCVTRLIVWFVRKSFLEDVNNLQVCKWEPLCLGNN